MKKIIQLAVLTSTVAASLNSMAGPKVIYGDDNRVEVYEASESNQILARSAATMINKSALRASPTSSGKFTTSQLTLKEWFEAKILAEMEEAEAEAQAAAEAAAAANSSNPPVEPLAPDLEKLLKMKDVPKISFCAEERFVNQPIPGVCSGFLIAPDLIVTAGHCLTIDKACENYKWVFDFKVDKTTQLAGDSIPQSDIYSCKKIITGALNNNYGLDFGVIQLNRDVVGRAPLKIRTVGKVADNAKLVLIGSPSGLPLKVASGAKVRTNTHDNYFVANTDSYQGNSGSAVFNEETGVVEGILVRGENDFVPNLEKLCFESNKCESDSCRGEDISRLTSIPEIALDKIFRQVAVIGRADLVKQILSFKLWVDFYTADKVTTLMEASRAGQVEVVKLLLEGKADPKLSDINGNSAIHYAVNSEPTMNEKSLEVIKELLVAKADINLKNKLGETVLFEAVRSGNIELVNGLIELGALANLKNDKGESILDFARGMNNKELGKIIKATAARNTKSIKNEIKEKIREIKLRAKQEIKELKEELH